MKRHFDSNNWVGILSGVFLIFFGDVLYGQTRDSMLMMGESGFSEGNRINYQFIDTPEHSGNSPSITDQQEEGQFIVAKSSVNTWSVHERLGRLHLNSPVTIPGTGLTIPQSLWSMEVGGAYGHRRENGHSMGLNFSVGSDSDLLFNSVHETVLRATANYRLPLDLNHAWLFFLSYSNNRYFSNNVPLPGFAYYFYSPTYKVRALLGFPFISVFYTPTPVWEGQLSIFGPRRISAEVSYKIVKALKSYGRFEWGQQEWLRANRENNSDRLFFDRKRLMVGLRFPIASQLSMDTAVGREFDRRFFEHDSSSTQNVSTAKLPDSTFLEAKLSWRFAGIEKEQP